MKAYLEKTAALFFVFGMVFIPLGFYGSDFQLKITRFLFLYPVEIIQVLLGADVHSRVSFSSDTLSFYILFGLLLLLAALCVFVLRFFKVNTSKLVSLCRLAAIYYLSFILLKYGFDKVFKAQFYLPEPNILFTRFGNLSKDILYWSTMGTSYTYSLAVGTIEVIIALLILMKRTRVLGLLLAVGAFMNIVIVNFGFDISVKTFSCFLLAMTLFLLAPFFSTLYDFFIAHKKAEIKEETSPFVFNKPLKTGLKTFVIGLMLLQVLYPYLASENTNDDKTARIFLHGAYSVNQMIIDGDTLEPADFPIQKVFVHRNSYFIFQKANEDMTDYFMKNNLVKKQLELYDYHQNKLIIDYQYSEKDSILELNFTDGKKWKIIAKALDWKRCPVFRNEFSETEEE